MLDYQALALQRVREAARKNHARRTDDLRRFCSPFHVDADALVKHALRRPITLNFHPDRLAGNGKTVLDHLMEQGFYHGQFRTGTTNGGKTATTGGERFCWEQRLFQRAYPASALDRPKYGALNLFGYLDGASVRFGSCYFVLKPEIINRCTFAYGDSSSNPATICTADTFANILADLLDDVQRSARMLNQVVSSPREALAILSAPCTPPKRLGKNLDYCIEAHIHGDVSLLNDVESLYLDASFQDTALARQADELCRRYAVRMDWISQRRMAVEEIGDLFRGPMIPVLARKIDDLFGHRQGFINARLIGDASRDSMLRPQAWYEIGTEPELFQYFKQLWHTVGYFG
jgi:hypothetical protein